jgi:hypothetical protein
MRRTRCVCNWCLARHGAVPSCTAWPDTGSRRQCSSATPVTLGVEPNSLSVGYMIIISVRHGEVSLLPRLEQPDRGTVHFQSDSSTGLGNKSFVRLSTNSIAVLQSTSASELYPRLAARQSNSQDPAGFRTGWHSKHMKTLFDAFTVKCMVCDLLVAVLSLGQVRTCTTDAFTLVTCTYD